jgi:hypothetical protein
MWRQPTSTVSQRGGETSACSGNPDARVQLLAAWRWPHALATLCGVEVVKPGEAPSRRDTAWSASRGDDAEHRLALAFMSRATPVTRSENRHRPRCPLEGREHG